MRRCSRGRCSGARAPIGATRPDDATALSGIVLATGGGAVLSAVNRDNLRENGLVIYLRGTPERLFERTRHDRNRPLLQTENPLARLRELYQQRDPLYREIADVVIDTGRQSVAGMTQALYGKLDLLRRGLPLPDPAD